MNNNKTELTNDFSASAPPGGNSGEDARTASLKKILDAQNDPDILPEPPAPGKSDAKSLGKYINDLTAHNEMSWRALLSLAGDGKAFAKWDEHQRVTKKARVHARRMTAITDAAGAPLGADTPAPAKAKFAKHKKDITP